MARSNGGNGGSFFDLDFQVIATSDTTYTMRVVLYLTSLSVSDSVNDLTISGSGWWRTGVAALGGAYNASVIWYQDVVVARLVGSPNVCTVTASWSSVEYWGTTLSATATYAVPAQASAPSVPSAPPAPSVSSITTTTANINFSAPASNGATIDSYGVRVQTNPGGTIVYDTDVAAGSPRGVTGLTANTDYNAFVQAHNAVGWGAWSPARAFTSAMNPPAAPTGASVARNSDTSHTVSWTRTNPDSASAPYQSQQVQRSTDGGAWATVAAALAKTVTSYTDTTTSADHSYAYRVKAVNSSSSSAYATTSTIYTTPKVPGTPTAAKSGSNIVVTFTNAARHDTGIKVYESADGGAFTLLATVATANLTSYTHIAPSTSVTHAYKVATYNGTFISAQSAASNTVQLLSAPNAPTGLGPTAVRDATDPVTLVWRHNPVDSTGQTAFQVRHRAVGAGTWTTETAVTSGTSAWVMPGDTYANPTDVEWQVATKGQHASYSPFSATATLPASARPTVAISAPPDASVVDTSALTVTWEYYDAESTAQTAWTVGLLDADDVLVESLVGAGAATTVMLATVVPDATAWTVRVAVQDADGMWSVPDTAAVTIAYAPPPTPTVTLTWDPEAATVTVEVTNPATGVGEVDVDHVDLWRAIDDRPWFLIATGVPANTTVTDWSPTVAGTNRYRAEAVSALPSVASSAVVEQTTAAEGLWISGGPGFSQVCRVRSNVVIGIDAGRAEKVLRQYAGRDHPVERTGTAQSVALTIDADILVIRVQQGLASGPAAWEALSLLPGPHLWRDLDGRYVYVSLSPVGMRRSPGGHVYRLSLAATQVDE